MKFLFLSILLLCGCAIAEQRLPEPTGTAKPPPQWIDYCRREGQEDPSCQQFLKTI